MSSVLLMSLKTSDRVPVALPSTGSRIPVKIQLLLAASDSYPMTIIQQIIDKPVLGRAQDTKLTSGGENKKTGWRERAKQPKNS